MLLLTMMSLAGTLSTVDFYVGTYTSPNGSQGIYAATLDQTTGKISEPQFAIRATNPSYLALARDGAHLYAVNESDHGSVSAFMVGVQGLSLLNTQPLQGSAPCHLSIDRKQKNLYTASYVGGVVQRLPIEEDGSLGPAKETYTYVGHGPNPDRQEAPHMHWVQDDPQGRFLYACDLGTDTVHISPTSRKDAVFSDGHVPSGAGARHGAFSKDGKFLYVNNEMGNSVTVFAVNPATSALDPKQTITTLPEGEHSVGSAEIAIHPNGHYLYVSNRGHDSIAVYEIGGNGLLTLLQVAPAGVKIPRGFGIDPSGKWIVVGGQNSNDLVSIPIDPATGQLGKPSVPVPLGSPVCIVFATARPGN